MDRARLLRLAGAAGLGAGSLAFPGAAGAARPSFVRNHPRWRFAFINHATTNPFFVPVRYGIADACSLYDVHSTWTGSRRSDVRDMRGAMRQAIRQGVDGIAVSIIDPHLLDATTEEALAAGIPVISYNADGSRSNDRLAYVGQDLYQSGLKVGARIVELVREGDVFLFAATPGHANIQPRVDGVMDAIRDSGQELDVKIVPTGADVGVERRLIEEAYLKNKSLRGMFAVDGGSTQGVAEVMREHKLHRKGVRAGGYDLLPSTLRAIFDRHLDFSVDQQPYLQGFIPVQQLFFMLYSGGLVLPVETNTGLKFVTRQNVKRLLTTRTRYGGTSPAQEYPIS